MNNENAIEQIELSMAHAKLSTDNMKALTKLLENPEFIKIVTDGYFKEEASRVVLLKADPSMKEHREELDNQIIAIGYLRQYFHTIMQLGRMAEKAIADDEETREELLQEAG